MGRYIMRLDDACEKRDIEKWNRMECLLDKYNIKPLVGIIPHCEDPEMERYPFDEEFWNIVFKWINKGWNIALHGYNHVYCSKDGGINPVNCRSEFAGISYEQQAWKIREGVKVFREHGIEPKIFFAPSHTFDENTLKALEKETTIRVVSDTIANDIYKKYGFWFIPQQSGHVRQLKFKVVTFCYHPNMMEDLDFKRLEKFLKDNNDHFIAVNELKLKNRKKGIYDNLLSYIYFLKKVLKKRK